MRVHPIEPGVDANALLTGAQFVDAYSIAVDDAALDARHAAERMFRRSPRWIDALLAVRNCLVAPFGLKTGAPAGDGTADIIGIFPVVSETPARLVAGFDDRHLDFRVVVDVTSAGDSHRVTATTLVLTHNVLGRVYLAIILPFHRLIVPSMLRQVAGRTVGPAGATRIPDAASAIPSARQK
jgi:hypothetical protein